MTEYYIALDVHCAFSEMAVMTGNEKLVLRDRCETRIPSLRELIAIVRRPRRLTFEEGPLADWLTRERRAFYAYIDAPQRFRSKAALWRYSGIGLERRHSGRGPVQTRLSRQGNRRLKNVLLGAAQAAIAQAENPYADKYRYWTQEKGTPAPNARRNVARSIAATLWSLWKTGQTFDAKRVAVPMTHSEQL